MFGSNFTCQLNKLHFAFTLLRDQHIELLTIIKTVQYLKYWLSLSLMMLFPIKRPCYTAASLPKNLLKLKELLCYKRPPSSVFYFIVLLKLMDPSIYFLTRWASTGQLGFTHHVRKLMLPCVRRIHCQLQAWWGHHTQWKSQWSFCHRSWEDTGSTAF